MSIEQTRAAIGALITTEALPPAVIAQRLGMTEAAVTAVLRGMHNRREVLRLKPAKHAAPYRYRLREGKA